MSPIFHDILLAVLSSLVGAGIVSRFLAKKLDHARKQTNQLLALLDVTHSGSMRETVSGPDMLHAIRERVQEVEFHLNPITESLTVTLTGRERSVAHQKGGVNA